MDKYTRIKNLIEDDLTDGDKISVWNEYCSKNSYEDTIYNMSMIDELMQGLTPFEILKRGSDIDIDDDYFWETIYGAKSGDINDCPIEYSNLARYIVDNDDDLYNRDIRDLLDEMEGEEDD